MNTYKLILIFLALATISCNAVVDEQPLEESVLTDYQGISICVSEATTRTALDPDDMASVEWLTDDCIYLWAKEDGATSYSFSEAEFKQKYFFETYSHAVFTADVTTMSAGTYSYFGVYPKPTGVSGSEVTFALPGEQSGLYDGELDIMVASPVTGGALGGTPDGDLALSFSHMTHALRINIPDGRNLFEQGVRTLEVTFPSDVVGNFSFDAASSAPTTSTSLSGGSSVVTLNFEEELNEGDQYAWIFIAPCELDGTLSFRAYDNNGYKSEEISTTINKTMEAGSVTPITLTVPEATPVTTLEMTIKNNYLGEEIETMTVTAPSGALFANGSSTVELPYSADGVYSVGYYTDDYDAAFKAGSISITYESENAIVSGDAISLSGITENTTNSFSSDVPYLFVEDFSGVTSTGSYDDFEDLIVYPTVPGLDYWSGRIFYYNKNSYVALKAYCLIWAHYYALLSLDLSGLTGLKSGKTVSLSINFYADWKQNKFSKMNLLVYNDDDDDNSVSITMSNNDSASSITTPRSVTLDDCTSESVISWKTNASSGTIVSSYDYVYMDNIKISIAN